MPSLSVARILVLYILLCATGTVVAQATFVDSVLISLRTDPDDRAALYRKFLDRQNSLSLAERDSAFQILNNNLHGLPAETAFDFIFQLTRSGISDTKPTDWARCIAHIESLVEPDTLYLCKSLNFYAEALNAAADLQGAKAAYLRVIRLLPPELIDEELAVAHHNLGALLNRINDPGAALSNYEKAHRIFKSLLGPDHYYIGTIGSNIGQVYAQLQRYDEQIVIQEESMKIYLMQLGPDHTLTGNVYHNLGIAYRYKGSLEKSLRALDEALRIRKLKKDHRSTVHVLSEILQTKAAFPEIYDHQQLDVAYRSSISEGESLLEPGHAALTNMYNNYGLFLMHADPIQSANLMYKSILSSTSNFSPGHAFELPMVKHFIVANFQQVRKMENIGYALHQVYLQSDSVQYLHLANKAFAKGDSIIEILRLQLLHGASRHQLILEANDFYINASRTAMAIYRITQSAHDMNRLFEWVEKSRNWELIDKYMQFSRSSHIENNAILRDISALKDALPSVNLNDDVDHTDSLEQLESVLLEQLRLDYPEYFEYLYQYEVASLDSIQRICRNRDVQWLHYFVLGHSTRATILVTPDTVISSPRLIQGDSIKLHMDSLSAKIEARNWTFATHAHALYQMLIAPYDSILEPGLLYVSSAGGLDAIPFDILLPVPADQMAIDTLHRHYFVNQFSITLVPSGTFGAQTWLSNSSVSNSIFVAPDYSDQSLTYHVAEAQTCSNIMDGTFISGEPTPSEMLQWLTTNDVIHFAGHSYTHGTDLDSIYLLMGGGNDTLYLEELLKGQSMAELIVLSSCHSASGKPTKEGNVGLAYGFAFAGTPNVISSLWSVSDRETKAFFPEFYRRLKYGAQSVESLRQAKLSFLDLAAQPARHPYFWANWVHYGHPVQLDRDHFQLKPYQLVIALGIIFFIGLGVQRRSRRSALASSANSD